MCNERYAAATDFYYHVRGHGSVESEEIRPLCLRFHAGNAIGSRFSSSSGWSDSLDTVLAESLSGQADRSSALAGQLISKRYRIVPDTLYIVR